MRKALGVLPEEGDIKHPTEVCRILTELTEPSVAGHQKEPHLRHEGAADVSWRNAFTTDEYQSTGLYVGNLAFGCIDIGENPMLSTVLKQKLRAVGEIETKNARFRPPPQA